MTETCPCGAIYTGDGFSALNFRDAHAKCREAWQQRQRGEASSAQRLQSGVGTTGNMPPLEEDQ